MEFLDTFLWGILLLLIAYLVKKLLEPAPKFTPPPPPQPIVERQYTLEEIRPFDGNDGKPIYVAIKGIVYDISRGKSNYGPGGPYHIFGGRDATRALAKSSLDEADMDKGTEGISAGEMEVLNDWISMYETKYIRIGWLPGFNPDSKKQNANLNSPID